MCGCGNDASSQFPVFGLKTAAGASKALSRRQENRAEKRMDGLICQDLARLTRALRAVFDVVATLSYAKLRGSLVARGILLKVAVNFKEDVSSFSGVPPCLSSPAATS
jgi:hypothetical protein